MANTGGIGSAGGPKPNRLGQSESNNTEGTQEGQMGPKTVRQKSGGSLPVPVSDQEGRTPIEERVTSQKSEPMGVLETFVTDKEQGIEKSSMSAAEKAKAKRNLKIAGRIAGGVLATVMGGIVGLVLYVIICKYLVKRSEANSLEAAQQAQKLRESGNSAQSDNTQVLTPEIAMTVAEKVEERVSGEYGDEVAEMTGELISESLERLAETGEEMRVDLDILDDEYLCKSPEELVDIAKDSNNDKNVRQLALEALHEGLSMMNSFWELDVAYIKSVRDGGDVPEPEGFEESLSQLEQVTFTRAKGAKGIERSKAFQSLLQSIEGRILEHEEMLGHIAHAQENIFHEKRDKDITNALSLIEGYLLPEPPE